MTSQKAVINTVIATGFTFAGFTGDLLLNKYISNNALALSMVSPEEGPIAKCSLNVEGLESDELAIKDYAENEGMLDALVEQGIVQIPHRHVIAGFELIPVVRLVVQP